MHNFLPVHNETSSLWQSSKCFWRFKKSSSVSRVNVRNVLKLCKKTTTQQFIIYNFRWEEKPIFSLFCHCNSIYGAPGINTAILLLDHEALQFKQCMIYMVGMQWILRDLHLECWSTDGNKLLLHGLLVHRRHRDRTYEYVLLTAGSLWFIKQHQKNPRINVNPR